MAKMTKGMALLVLVMIISCAALLILNSRNRTVSVRDVPAPVVLSSPRRGSLSRTLRLTGVTESRSTVTVLPRISGMVDSMAVTTGSGVQKGDIVALIDDDAYRLTMEQARAALSGAEATYNRIEKLYRTNSVPPQTYDEALSAYEAAKAQYAMARLNLDWCEIRSPLSGTVLQTHQEEGALVSPQVPLVTIADLEHPEMSLNVPEEYYAVFSAGTTEEVPGGEVTASSPGGITVVIPALGETAFSGSIKYLAPWIAAESKTFELRLSLDDPEGKIRPGMFAVVYVSLERQEDIFWLEWKALDSQGRLWYLDDEGLPRTMEYEPLLEGDEGFQVPPGMEESEFIIEGQHFLTEGREIRVLQ